MTQYMVEPKSRHDIRTLANNFRGLLGLDNQIFFSIVELLDILPEILPGFNYELVEDDQLPAEIHADTDILTGNIRIRQSIYERACNGEGRDRMTIAHEIGHFIMLRICGYKLERNFNGKAIDTCRDPEWQAKCFAGELLVPAHLVKDMNTFEISECYGVSLDAAEVQYKKLRKDDAY